MDLVLIVLIGLLGGLSTLGMLSIFDYLHDKENE